jgi:prevent-host-death family protein
MHQINIHAAKTNLSALVEKAVAGEPFIIAKAGRPLVTVNPYTPDALSSRVGFLKNQAVIPDDFNSMGSDEISRLFM